MVIPTGAHQAFQLNSLDCLTRTNRRIDAKSISGALSNQKRKLFRPGQQPMSSGAQRPTLDERLKQAFPIGETIEAVIGCPLDAAICVRVLRHFGYPIWVSHSRVIIGEPPLFGNEDALRLVNRVLLWVWRNEHQIVRDAPWLGLRVVGQ